MLNKMCVLIEILFYVVKVKHLYSFYFHLPSLVFVLFVVILSNESFGLDKIQHVKLIVS